DPQVMAGARQLLLERIDLGPEDLDQRAAQGADEIDPTHLAPPVQPTARTTRFVIAIYPPASTAPSSLQRGRRGRCRRRQRRRAPGLPPPPGARRDASARR